MDDTTTTNNTWLAPDAITLAPKPVDYVVPSVGHTSGTVAGSAVNGSFTVKNQSLTAGGSATVYWRAYASADTTAGSNDFLLQQGSRAALAADTTSSAIGFSGTWPTTSGDWYLVVEVSASDDIDLANDVGSTLAPVTVSGAAPLDIDYIVVNPIVNSGATRGICPHGNLHGEEPGHRGRRPDRTLDRLPVEQRDAGRRLATPSSTRGRPRSWARGSPSGTITFDGIWPSPAATWYLFVAVSAADDSDPPTTSPPASRFPRRRPP